MPNPNDRHLDNRTPDLHPTNGDGSPRNAAPVTPVPATLNSRRPSPAERAYQDGYVSGQVTEQRIRQQSQSIRDNENAARGLLLGVAMTSLLGLTIGLLFLFSPKREPVPAIAPNASPLPNATTRQNTSRQTTVIERNQQQTVPVPVPVPQQRPAASSQPAQSTQPAPSVNNTVVVPPAQQPATQPAPTQQTSGQTGGQPSGQAGSTTLITPVPAGQTGTQNPNGNTGINPGINSNTGINNPNPAGTTTNSGGTVAPGNVNNGVNTPTNTNGNTVR